MAKPNCYQTLGLDPSVSDAEIKMAFFELARQYHPDKKADHHTFAYKRFQAMVNAYEMIKTPERRAVYDRQLFKGMPALAAPQNRHFNDIDANNDNENAYRTSKAFWNWLFEPFLSHKKTQK